MTEFDYATKLFTAHMERVAEWKHTYFGAAYSTRLRQAIKEARDACSALETALDEDDKPLTTGQA